MIGRSRERVLLHEEVVRAIAGRGRLVLIGGEAGIGKTTLARDAVQEARQRGALVLSGNCHDLTSSPPYAPWLDLATGYPVDPTLPPFPPAFAGGDLAGIQSQSALFSETLAFLTAIARSRPVVVLLEDLHWSDSASLELLRFLSARISELPVLLLITYRVDELTRRHPLYQQLPGLIRSGLGIRLDLRRLDESAIGELIRMRYRLPVDDEKRLLDYLEQHAQGNPFYATELLRALEEEGELLITSSGSSLAVLERLVLPTLLTQIIEARVGRLNESARKPLSIAAVIGEEIPIDLWAELSEIGGEDLFSVIEEATDASLLEASRDGVRVRFVHALTRDTLYESILPPRRRLWHRAVAEALMHRRNPDPDAVAHHLSQAGDERAPEWLVKAGNRAQRAYTWLIAAERFISAASSLESIAGSERARGWLLFRAARLMRLAHPERGIELLRESRRLAIESGDRLLAGDAHYSIGLLTIYSDRIGEGIDLIEAGIEMLEALEFDELRGDSTVAIALADSLPQLEGAADSDVESSLSLQRTSGLNHRKGSLPWWYAAAGKPHAALEFGEVFLAAANRLATPGGLVQSATGHCYLGLGCAFAAVGQPEEAESAFDTARSIYRTLDHHGVIAVAFLAELRHVTHSYRVEDVAHRRRLTEEAVTALDQAGGAMPTGFSSAVARLGGLVIDGGWDEVERVVNEIDEPGHAFVLRGMSEAIAEIAMHKGDRATAWKHVNMSLPDGPKQVFGSRFFQESLLFQRVASALSISDGQLENAEAWLEAHDSWLAASGSGLGASDGKLAWARYHLATGDLDAALVSATHSLGLAGSPRQPLALVRADRLLGEIETIRGRFLVAEQHLNAALDLTTRCEAKFERALTLVALAELRSREGRAEETEKFATEAEEVCRQLGAKPTLLRIEAMRSASQEPVPAAIPFGLTAREIEVLNLVSQGLTDATVAAQLFISPRTVGQHLRSIYGKLEVSSRSAATRIAIEKGIS